MAAYAGERYYLFMRTICLALWIVLTVGCSAGGNHDNGVADKGQRIAGAAMGPHSGAAEGVSGQLVGQIIERLRAGTYTYLALDTGADEPAWVVVMGRNVADVGERIRVNTMATRKDFHSRKLDRRFERLIFASIAKN